VATYCKTRAELNAIALRRYRIRKLLGCFTLYGLGTLIQFQCHIASIHAKKRHLVPRVSNLALWRRVTNPPLRVAAKGAPVDVTEAFAIVFEERDAEDRLGMHVRQRNEGLSHSCFGVAGTASAAASNCNKQWQLQHSWFVLSDVVVLCKLNFHFFPRFQGQRAGSARLERKGSRTAVDSLWLAHDLQ